MGEEDNLQFLKLAESIYSNIDKYDTLIQKLYISSESIDAEEFKKRLFKEINETEGTPCRPTKEEVTLEEIQDFFKEIENVPHKLQKQKKQKEIQKLNLTVMQRKDIACGSTAHPTLNQTISNPTSSNSNNMSLNLNVDCNLTPKEIFKNYDSCKNNNQNILKKIDDSANKMMNYNKEVEKVRKFISELEAMSNQDSKDQSSENAFEDEEEKTLDALVNAIEKKVFISENQNLFENIEDNKSIDSLNILMDTVNDLLKNIVI